MSFLSILLQVHMEKVRLPRFTLGHLMLYGPRIHCTTCLVFADSTQLHLYGLLAIPHTLNKHSVSPKDTQQMLR